MRFPGAYPVRIQLALVLAFLVTLLAANVFLVFRFASQEDTSATEINVAGRQRMLSQKMAKEANEIAAGDDSVRTPLGETANEFDQGLTYLIEGNAERGVASANGAEAVQLTLIEAMWDPFYEQIQMIQSSDVADPAFEAALTEINQNNLRLLEEIDDLVGLYETNFQEDIGTLKTAAFWLAAIGTVVAAAALLNMYRLFRQKEEDAKRIATANVQLEREIGERKRSEEMVRHLAYHDPLTNLPNRSLFQDRAHIAFAHAMRDSHKIAIASVDLDRFKLINDTLGHSTGDDILKSAAVRLAESIREGDTIARMGGDEFMVMLANCGTTEGGIEAASRLVSSLSEPFEIEGRSICVTASVGLSFFPDDGADLDSLIQDADAAMYRAKQNGRNNLQVYTPSMYSRAAERLEMESELLRALEHDELIVHYQPQVSVRSGEIVGVEALVRWMHPEKGLILPDEFIPLAEESGLIIRLGNKVLLDACQQAQDWAVEGFPSMRLAVNVSILQFERPDFAHMVASTLEQTGFDPRLLDLEVTESTIMQDPTVTKSVLDQLSGMGISIAIDDFGTGYSSLQHLRTFPIHVLKVDRSFVSDLPDDKNDSAIALSVINLAHSLNLTVIAEGVETQQQLDFLREHGCDHFQGYLFSKPLPAEELGHVMKSSGRGEATAAEKSTV